MKELYKQRLMDHYHASPYRGSLKHPTFSSQTHNPSCGDVVALAGEIQDGVLKMVRFEGKGCVISQAAASLLCEQVQGKEVANALRLREQDMISMVGIELGPIRLKCALLALHALQEGISAVSINPQSKI